MSVISKNMNNVAEKLHKWAIEEFNLASEGLSDELPNVGSFECLTKGKNRRIWNYVINHVRNESYVQKVKRTLELKKHRDTIQFDPFNTMSTKIITLETALTKATEKRTFLKQTLTSIEEKILNTERKIRNIIDETIKKGKKTAFLHILTIKYKNTNTSLNVLLEQIFRHLNYLHAYQSSYKTNIQPDLSLTYGFLIDSKFDSGFYGMKEITRIMSAIVENKTTKQNMFDDVLRESLQKKYSELKDSCFLLNDLVLFLRTSCDSDKQQFATAILQQSVTVKDLVSKSRETQSVKQIISQMKYDSVYYSVCTFKNKKKTHKLLVTKNQILKDKIEDLLKEETGCDFELRVLLLEKLTENIALVVSNTYLEESLKNIANETELLKRDCVDKYSCDLNSSIEKFFKYVNATFYLLNTGPCTFQKVLDDLNNLQAFVHNDLFSSQHLISENQISKLMSSSISNRELSWSLCERSYMIEPVKSEPYNFGDSVTSEFRKFLNMEPFETISTLYNKMIDLKEFLKTKPVVHSIPYSNDDNLSTSEVYSQIMEMFSEIKVSNESCVLNLKEGTQLYHESKTLLQEWWEQNAQYVPKIEYEGKSLKMWVDILCALNESV